MNLTHVSRSEMKKMIKNSQIPNGTLIISVNDTDDEMGVIMESIWGMHDILTIHVAGYVFADDNESFTTDAANDIMNEIDDCADVDIKNTIVHCFAGVSRSAAIAKWINDYLGLNMGKYNDYTQHNLHVYNTLCKVSGVDNLVNYYKDLAEVE